MWIPGDGICLETGIYRARKPLLWGCKQRFIYTLDMDGPTRRRQAISRLFGPDFSCAKSQGKTASGEEDEYLKSHCVFLIVKAQDHGLRL